MTSKDAADSANEIATVRIELEYSEPLIWREVEVPTSVTLEDLHDVIQATMGWKNYHLWEFTAAKRRYGVPSDEDMRDEPLVDAGEVRLRELLKPLKTNFNYLYDFGDSWGHRVTVTHIRAGDSDLAYPRFVGGERNGPPEDCGGIPGFYAKLETAADPEAPEHDEIKQWLGRYNPNKIDEAAIKKRLARIAKHLSAVKVKVARRKPSAKA